MALEYVQVCKTFSNHADGSISCSSFQFVHAYLIPSESSGSIDLFINGGFDTDTFMLGFMGVLLCWSIGLVAGMCVSVMRKIK